MAAPTPVSVTQTHFPGLTANPVIDLDDATVAGDRTVVFAFLGRSRPLGVTWPSPWVEAVEANNTAGNTMITTVGWVDHARPTTQVQLSFLCASISRKRQFTIPSQPGCGGAWRLNAAPGSNLGATIGRSHSESRSGVVSARHTFSGA